MKILVTVASRHSSTREIGEVIAAELRQAGHQVTTEEADQASDAEPFDAVVVGSAIYMGRWLADARHFVALNRPYLARVPVWMFSSGPLGSESPQPVADPAHLEELMQSIHARDHRVFVGKLDPTQLGLAERLTVRMVKAPAGDFREWEAIRAWAREIAAALAVPVA